MFSTMLLSRVKGCHCQRLISQGRLAAVSSSSSPAVVSVSPDISAFANASLSSAPGCNLVPRREFSLSSSVAMPFEKKMGPSSWPRYNKVVFPPQSLEEKRRPAYICHVKENFKYPPWKLWYVACLVRGMSVDEAIRQLDFCPKKGAYIVKQALLEAQELAVQNHNVEFRSNLWVAESFCGKGVVVKGIRRHARMRVGLVEYFHSHYFVRLEEGPPPENYYEPSQPDGPTLLQRWVDERRAQKIQCSL